MQSGEFQEPFAGMIGFKPQAGILFFQLFVFLNDRLVMPYRRNNPLRREIQSRKRRRDNAFPHGNRSLPHQKPKHQEKDKGNDSVPLRKQFDYKAKRPKHRFLSN